jgi:hypothetical protein
MSVSGTWHNQTKQAGKTRQRRETKNHQTNAQSRGKTTVSLQNHKAKQQDKTTGPNNKTKQQDQAQWVRVRVRV